ncbi:MAG: Do family serine endopeptidase [Paludibacteraceae bacterium]
MNVNKSKAIAFIALIVVFVSIATNLATNYFVNRNTSGYDADGASQTAKNYARFANATKGVDTDFTVAADLTVHAVVHIKTKGTARQSQSSMFDDPFFEYFFGPQQKRNRQQSEETVPLGSGSGVIISNDGYIVTNNHVIANSTEIEVTLNDKHTFKAKLIGADPNTDIALIKVDAKNLPTVSFGNSDDLKVGEWVLAVGNPFNLTSTVTAGIVSAKARSIGILSSNGSGNMPIESFIQTDAAINPGNSGGALVNTKGELVGINAAIASQTGSYSGYGFAVPSSIVKKVVTDLREHGAVQRAILGVNIANLDSEAAEVKTTIKDNNIKTLNGALVMNLVEKGAAERAGIKKGDVINTINNVEINSVAELQEQIGRYSPGDKVEVGILRNNKSMKIKVELINAQGNTKLVTSDGTIGDLGAKFAEIDTKIQKSLGLEYGVQVESLSKGKFEEQGVKAGFIIVKINSKPIRSEADIKTVFEEASKSNDKVLYIAGVYPNGKVAYYAINLEN